MIPSPQEKANLKENENILRFQTYCIFERIDPTEEMLIKVKSDCRKFYEENPEKIMVPKEVLLGATGLAIYNKQSSLHTENLS